MIRQHTDFWLPKAVVGQHQTENVIKIEWFNFSANDAPVKSL